MLIVYPALVSLCRARQQWHSNSAEVVAGRELCQRYGKLSVNVDYRFRFRADDETVYTGQQPIDFSPASMALPFRSPILAITPTSRQIGDGPGNHPIYTAGNNPAWHFSAGLLYPNRRPRPENCQPHLGQSSGLSPRFLY